MAKGVGKLAKVDVSSKDFEKIRRSPEVKRALRGIAEDMRDEAGMDGYVTAEGEGRTRSRAAVIAASVHARRSDARNGTLNKVLARWTHNV